MEDNEISVSYDVSITLMEGLKKHGWKNIGHKG